MIMSKSKPITPAAAIFYGGLIAGILDATDGVVAYYFIGGLNPIRVLQFIASGFYGAESPFSLPLLLNGVLAHALLVGLPIALAARRITNQSSFSTQALNDKAQAFRRNS